MDCNRYKEINAIIEAILSMQKIKGYNYTKDELYEYLRGRNITPNEIKKFLTITLKKSL